MRLKRQKSWQLYSSDVDRSKEVTSHFRVSSMEQEEYLLTLQRGCETEFLDVCHGLFDPWEGKVESLLVVFPRSLQRQEIVLPSAKPARRVPSAVPLLAATRAGCSHGWSARAVPERESERGRACRSLPAQTRGISTCCASLFGRRIGTLLPQNMLILGYNIGFIALYKRSICLQKLIQVRRVTLSAGGERPAPFLPAGNIPAEHQCLSCFCLFPALILSYFILLGEYASDGLYLTGRTGGGQCLT